MRLVDYYYDWLGRVAPNSLFGASPWIMRNAWARPLRAFGYPRLGLFEHDELSGWRLRPGATVTHPDFNFRARYTIDGEGRRVTHSAAGGLRPALHFIGCSWTFGWGVDDHETYPALLARDRRVVNWSVPGYGLGHHYLGLERRGILRQAATDGAIVIYPWMYHHQCRHWRRRSWFATREDIAHLPVPGAANPLFEIEHRALVHRGLIRAADGVDDSDPIVDLMEFRIMRELCAATAAKVNDAGLRFVVVLLPQFISEMPERTRRLREQLDRLGIETIALHRPEDSRDVRYMHRFDRHPNARGHAEIARRLTAALGG